MKKSLEVQENSPPSNPGDEADNAPIRDLTLLQRLVTPKNVILVFTIIAIFVLAIVPLVYLVVKTITDSGSFSLEAFARAYKATEQAPKMAANSLIYATMASALAATVGASLAYAVIRTNVALRSFLWGAGLGHAG